MNHDVPFGWDRENNRPILKLYADKVGSGVEFVAFGADDDEANTMLAVLVNGKRELTKRPEPMMITYFAGLIEAEEFVLSLDCKPPEVIKLSDEEVEEMKQLVDDLKDGLEDAPLGGV